MSFLGFIKLRGMLIMIEITDINGVYLLQLANIMLTAFERYERAKADINITFPPPMALNMICLTFSMFKSHKWWHQRKE